MSILDDTKKIKKIDKKNVLGSIEQLWSQCEQAWRETSQIKVPSNYKKVKNIVVNGMGGSALGAHIIQSLFSDRIKIPLEMINSYTLPRYVNKDTLYILSSYSGNTEEPLNTCKEALKRKAKILGITTGGKLVKFLRKNNLPAYIFSPQFNPSSQPRMGLGYSIFGQIGLLKQCGFLNIIKKESEEVFYTLKKLNNQFGIKIKRQKNPAKKIAQILKGKIPILIGSEHLVGNLHIIVNQINESAKNFSCYFPLPELNHHLMEGLTNPKNNSKNLIFVFIESNLYLKRIQLRYKITKEVLKKKNIEYVEFKAKEKTKILQSFEILLFGSYLSFYLSMLYKIDPSLIPWVEYFKKRLSEY